LQNFGASATSATGTNYGARRNGTRATEVQPYIFEGLVMKFPSKKDREDLEIKDFIRFYRKLGHGRRFEIDEDNREQPDYTLRDCETGQRFGVELTSVYLDNRSVPDVHMDDLDEMLDIPYDKEEMKRYRGRIIDAILAKTSKARKGYDTSWPLILGLYVNEYISIYMREDSWQSLVDEHEEVFDSISPFTEIVFWPLPNDGIVSVKPD